MSVPQKSKQKKMREAGMMIATGVQGVGKTYLNMHIIFDYVRDKMKTGVRGRKCLIMDTNGEYTKEQFALNDIPNFDIKTISVKDIPEWSYLDKPECRRIDAKSLGIAEKKEVIQFVIKNYINGMLVLEDINTYILNVTHMEEIIGGLVNLRHRAVDMLISYQSLRAVEPRMYANSRWMRMHYQSDNVSDIKNKIANLQLYKIAQIIVNDKYLSGDKHFYLYIYNNDQKIEGAFSKNDFKTACRKYLNSNKKSLIEYKNMNNCTLEEALTGNINQLYNQYYGNSNK